MPRPTHAELAKAPRYVTLLALTEEGPEFGTAFRALKDGDVVWTDQGERMALEDFVGGSVRCAEDGSPLVSLGYPLHVQYDTLRKASEANVELDVDAHLDDLAAQRMALPFDASEIEDLPTRAGAHLYDALAAGLTDRPVELPPEERGPDPVIRLMSRETRIEEGNWQRLSDMPTFQAAPLRRMARDMLAPVLGNMATLEDLRMIMIPKDEIERGAALRRWIAGCPESREVGTFAHPAMPGYRTGVAVLAERADVTLVTFEDAFASYAYVWKSTPDVVLDLGPEDPEDDEAPGPRW